MKRLLSLAVLAVVAVVAGPTLLADVKTREKTTLKFEGLMGGFINRMAGGSDGITSTVAVKGERMASMNDTAGQIVDLTEQKIYTLDMKKKEYRVLTFAEMRKQMEDMKKSLEQQSQQMKPEDKAAMQEAGKSLEFDADVKETGQTKTIGGFNARQVILTITMREKGKTLEEGGGMVMTNDMWIAPKIAALDELHAFHMKFFKAVYGGVFTGVDLQQANMLSALLPGFGALSEKMAAEGRKLQGTPIMTMMTIESVRSAEQMKAAGQQPSGGGGIGGALAGRLMRRGPVQQRSKAMTSTHELLSVSPSAGAEDVAIPTGFKEKK